MSEAAAVYKAVIIKILEGLMKAYADIQSADRMVQIHRGIQTLPETYSSGSKLPTMHQRLTKLTAEEYVETIKSQLGLESKVKPHFFEVAAKYQREIITEVKVKADTGIADIQEAYDLLLAERDGRILLLIDEAGSLGRAFFTEGATGSLFESLMNQLRTSEFIRTKIAIYPHSYSDVLFETRYGDLVELTENVVDDIGYNQFRKKALALIERYATQSAERDVRTDELFEIGDGNSSRDDALEQILYASGGNMRR
jgi:hypothetical protein